MRSQPPPTISQGKEAIFFAIILHFEVRLGELLSPVFSKKSDGTMFSVFRGAWCVMRGAWSVMHGSGFVVDTLSVQPLLQS